MSKQGDLLEAGLYYDQGKKEGRKKKALREAKELGTPPHLVETISDWRLSNIEQCAYLFRTGVEMNLGPTKKDPNRSFGSAIGKGFEDLARGKELSEAIATFGKKWRALAAKCDFVGKKFAASEFLAMGPKILKKLAVEIEDSEILEDTIEHSLDWAPIKNPATGEQIAGFVFSGRCDFGRTKPGDPGPVVEDLKTIANLTAPAERAQRIALMPQMTIYSVLASNDSTLSQAGFGEYVSRLEANKRKGEVAVARMPVRQVTQEDRAGLFYRTGDAIMRILAYRRAEEGGAPVDYAWPKNDAACFGMYGLCDQAPMCYPELFPEVDLEADFGLKEWD